MLAFLLTFSLAAQELEEVVPTVPEAQARTLQLQGYRLAADSAAGNQWWNAAWSHTTGYVKLVTPIVHNESNMFTIRITAYYYSPTADSVEIRCSGYAYSAASLINASCHTEGTDLPVEIATETRPGGTAPVVVIRLGTPATIWYYPHFSAEYTGWVAKAQGDFTWVAGETTPVMVNNTNGILANDRAGTLTVGVTGASTATTRLTVNGGANVAGNVGIGIAPHATQRLTVEGPSDLTTFPGTPMTVMVGSSQPYSAANNGSGISFWSRYNAAGASTAIAVISGVKEVNTDGNFAGALTFGTRETATGAGSIERMRIRSSGEVVIGQTGNSGTKLVVNGDVVVGGNIGAKYQDVAEWVPVTQPMPAGTVVVLDKSMRNRVKPSLAAYDTTVAGVVSARPGLILGEAGDDKAMIATTGRVLVRVDATARPVEIGDLIVTSDKPGVAMVSAPVDVSGIKMHRPGTIIGKALEPLAAGEGEVLVLLSLQ